MTVVHQALKNFPAFYGTWRFIIEFTRTLHWVLPWDRSIQSIPLNFISLRSILILPTHLQLGLLSGLFHSGFSTNILFAFLFSPLVLHVISHPSWLDHSNYIWQRGSSSLHSFLQPLVTSSLFSLNTLLSTQFSNSNILSPCSFLCRDQVSTHKKTTCKITVVHILNFSLLIIFITRERWFQIHLISKYEFHSTIVYVIPRENVISEKFLCYSQKMEYGTLQLKFSWSWRFISWTSV
jgi:hypothetical protein